MSITEITGYIVRRRPGHGFILVHYKQQDVQRSQAKTCRVFSSRFLFACSEFVQVVAPSPTAGGHHKAATCRLLLHIPPGGLSL